MSALRAAEGRASGALERLERVLKERLKQASGDPAQFEADCRRLQDECAALRRDLEAANERNDRLRELVAHAEERIEDAIDRVDELAANGSAP